MKSVRWGAGSQERLPENRTRNPKCRLQALNLWTPLEKLVLQNGMPGGRIYRKSHTFHGLSDPVWSLSPLTTTSVTQESNIKSLRSGSSSVNWGDICLECVLERQSQCPVAAPRTDPSCGYDSPYLLCSSPIKNPHTRWMSSACFKRSTLPYEMVPNLVAEGIKRLSTSPSRQRVLSQETMILK